MGPSELGQRAVQEAAELGPQPNARGKRSLWRKERHGAAVLLAALADYEPMVLRRAGLVVGSPPKTRRAAPI